MNWELTARAPVGQLLTALDGAEPSTSWAEGEDEATPIGMRSAAIDAAVMIAEDLVGVEGEVLATLAGHETLDGDFRPAHVSVTVSRIAAPEAAAAG